MLVLLYCLKSGFCVPVIIAIVDIQRLYCLIQCDVTYTSACRPYTHYDVKLYDNTIYLLRSRHCYLSLGN